MIVPRRKFLTGFASLLAAPAIVPIASLMPVKPVLVVPTKAVVGFSLWVSNSGEWYFDDFTPFETPFEQKWRERHG